MKQINYRDAVSITLPDTWEVQDEPGVQAALFERRLGAGTLRVSVFGFTKDEDGLNQPMPAPVDGPFLELGSGARMFTQSRPAPGRPHLLMRNWIFQVPEGPNSYRMVFFSHTIDAARKDDPAAVAEFERVDLAVREAQISTAASLPLYDRFSASGSVLG
jgi:hypothetical protein